MTGGLPVHEQVLAARLAAAHDKLAAALAVLEAEQDTLTPAQRADAARAAQAAYDRERRAAEAAAARLSGRENHR